MKNKTVIPHVSLSCHECSASIKVEDLLCEACHAPIIRRYCPKCSGLVPDNSEVCAYCGASADSPKRSLQLSQLSHFQPTPVALFVCFVLALLLIAQFPLETARKPATATARARIEHSDVKLGKSSASDFISRLQPLPARDSDGSEPPASTKGSVAIDEGMQLNVQAHKLISDGQFEEAVPILKKAVGLFPDRTPVAKYALYNLGYALRRTGKVNEAIPVLEKCVKLDHTWAKAQTELKIAKSRLSSEPMSSM